MADENEKGGNEVMDQVKLSDLVGGVVDGHKMAAIGGGLGAAVGAALAGPIGAAVGGGLGGLVGSWLERETPGEGGE